MDKKKKKSWKGRKYINRHQNRIKRSGQARLVYVFDINRDNPTTWRRARGVRKNRILTWSKQPIKGIALNRCQFVCACARAHTHTHTHTHMLALARACLSVCSSLSLVCVCFFHIRLNQCVWAIWYIGTLSNRVTPRCQLFKPVGDQFYF